MGCGWRDFGKDWIHIDGGDYPHLDSTDILNLPHKNNSVDLIYTDLPYATKSFGGCTDCDWDKPVDLEKMWEHFMRIKKINTPIFFSCNTKLGYDLIKYAPKKCPFRYDLIWVKSNKSGFLSSKRQPLRSHELVYVFYENGWNELHDISPLVKSTIELEVL